MTTKFKSESERFKAFRNRVPKDVSRIMPFESFSEEIVKYVESGGAISGTPLPWERSRDLFRLRPENMTVWAGYNFDGKSSLLSMISLWMVLKNEKTFLISPEMKPAMLGSRLARQAIAVNEPSARSIRDTMRWIGNRICLYDQQGLVEPETAVDLARYAADVGGYQHIVIDSLTKLGLAGDDYSGQKRLVNELHTIALDYGVHVHLVCHLRKSSDLMRQPSFFDVRGGGEIADQPSNIIIVWKNRRKLEKLEKLKEVKGYEDSEEYNDAIRQPDTQLIIEKQRDNGIIGKFPLWFHPASTQMISGAKAKPMLTVREAIENDAKNRREADPSHENIQPGRPAEERIAVH